MLPRPPPPLSGSLVREYFFFLHDDRSSSFEDGIAQGRIGALCSDAKHRALLRLRYIVGLSVLSLTTILADHASRRPNNLLLHKFHSTYASYIVKLIRSRTVLQRTHHQWPFQACATLCQTKSLSMTIPICVLENGLLDTAR